MRKLSPVGRIATALLLTVRRALPARGVRNPLLYTALLSCVACGASAAVIDRPVVEQTGADTYSIAFDAPAQAYPVRVLQIPQPGHAGAEKQLASATKSPIEVHLPAGSGQPFFRLAPKSGEAIVVSIRRLPLDGAPNFRDLGGYRTTDGHQLRWGTLYRAGQLSALTEGDFKYLSNLGIKLICDFRIDSERGRAPTKWQGETSPEIIATSVDTLNYPGQTGGLVGHYQLVYTHMPFDGAPQYALMLRRMINGDLPMVFHCTAGKDRTGFFAAVLMTLLGVPHETVVEDFALTNKYLAPDDKIPEMAKQMQERQNLPELPSAEAVRLSVGVLPANLEIGFNAIRQKYGSIENYAREALLLTADDMAKLRARLLE
jgi:protein-tyrosine phosphatase